MAGRYIITGTDTGVGKTIAAAALAGFLGAQYWKPVQAGLDEETDTQCVARLTQGRAVIHPEAYRLTTPCSPHEAARLDGVDITIDQLTLPDGADPLVVEGAGGVMVPFADGLLAADIFAHWALPVILVARTTLGTINHSLLSIEALRARGCSIHGVLFVGEEISASERAITHMGQVQHLGRLPMLNPLTPETLSKAFMTQVRTELL